MTAGGVLVSVTSVMAVSAGWEHPRAWCRQPGPEPGKTLRYLVAWRPAPAATGSAPTSRRRTAARSPVRTSRTSSPRRLPRTPGMGRGACRADHPQRPRRIRRQGADQPGTPPGRTPPALPAPAGRAVSRHRPGSPRRSPSITTSRSGSFPGHVLPAAPATGPGPAGRPSLSPVIRNVSASSKAPACDTSPFPSADTVILGRHAVFCTG
jgi:hypothetical protein